MPKIIAMSLFALLLPTCSTGGPAPLDDSARGLPEVSTQTTPSGIRITALLTGWVGIKEAHWHYAPPAFLAPVRITMDSRWHEWIPNIVYLVEHPEKTILVDTGSGESINDPDYFACNLPANRFFYNKNLRFLQEPEGRVDRMLERLGKSAADIDEVLITHWHGDHVGNLHLFPNARVFTGTGNWPEHLGSMTCHLPADFRPTTIDYRQDAVGVFPNSDPRTRDGRVRFVPLPGHTPGHAGLVVQDGDSYWLMVGDATFNLEQTRANEIAGVSENVADARSTQATIHSQLKQYATILLPAHEHAAMKRLASSDAE